MKAIVLAALMCLTFVGNSSLAEGSQNILSSKKADKNQEPVPKSRDENRGGGEEPRSLEETYEGNDRSGGIDLDGGESRLLNGGKSYPITRNLRTEDQGDVIIFTLTEHEDISADETCTTITRTVVEKVTKKVLKTDTKEFCNRWTM